MIVRSLVPCLRASGQERLGFGPNSAHEIGRRLGTGERGALAGPSRHSLEADARHLYTEIRDTARSMRFKELVLEHVIGRFSRFDRYIVVGLRLSHRSTLQVDGRMRSRRTSDVGARGKRHRTN